MTADEVRLLTESTLAMARQRLREALTARIDEEPDHTLQRLLERFEGVHGDDQAAHAFLDLADWCAGHEMQAASVGQPLLFWARAKRCADALAAAHLAALQGQHVEAMTLALAGLERVLWLQAANKSIRT